MASLSSFSLALRSCLVVIGTGAAALACSSSSDADPTAATSTDTALVTTGTAPECQTLFFANHPHTGQVTLSSGASVEVPFWGCDVDSTLVFGLVDLPTAQAALQGTGFAPYWATVNGVAKGFAALYLERYRVSDGGTYNELLVGFHALPGSAPAEVPWVNDYSVVAPTFAPSYTLFIDRMYLNHELPVLYGREIIGLDKRLGLMPFDLSTTPDVSSSFFVTDEKLSPIVSSHIEVDTSPAAAAAAATGLEQALGIPSLPPPPSESLLTLATRDVERPGSVNVVPSYAHWSLGYPTVNDFDAAKDDVRLYAGSEVGALLSSGHFDPRAVYYDAHTQIVVEPAAR